MADRAMTREAVLAGLQDIRLPADAPGGLAAEVLAAIGIGLVIAALAGLLLRAVTSIRIQHSPPSRADKVAALNGLADDARVLELLHLLKSERPERYAVLADAIYRPGGTPAPSKLEAELVLDD